MLKVQADNTTKIDLDVPHLRPLFYLSDGVMAVFLTLFVLLALVSAASNVSLLLLILKQKLYKESLTLCLANMMMIHIVEVCLVLPLCLATRLVQNWVLGEIVCYMLPLVTVIIRTVNSLLTFIHKHRTGPRTSACSSC